MSTTKACQNYFPVLLCTTKSLDKALPSTTLYYKACTKHIPVLLCTTKFAQTTSQYYFVLQSLHKAHSSTTLYYKACTKHVPVLLCTTKFAQTTSQYYFVLQSLHKAHSSTTLYYKVCTNYFPVLLCTTKLAQSTFQYYFVLQSLHKTHSSTTLYYKACKTLPSTTVYYKACISYFPVLLCTTLHYKACTNYFPVLLCTTRLAQSPSQCYFVLQSLHKLLPSTTLYYKACTKSFPVLLCTTKLAQSTSQYCFVLQKACAKHFRLHQLFQRHRIFCCCTERPMQPQTLPCHVSNSPLLSAFFFGAWSPAHLRSQARAQHLQPFFQDSAICCPASQYGKTRLHKSMAGSSCIESPPPRNWTDPVVVRSSSLCMLRSPTNNWPFTCKACKVHNADSSSAKRCGWPSGLAVKCTVPTARMAPLPRSCTCTANNRRGDSGAKGDTDMRNLRMVAVFCSMPTSKGSALTLPRPMAVATSYPWLRAICNKSSTHDGVTSCKHKISHLQSMSWKPSSRFFTCKFSVPKVTRTSAQLTSAFKSAAGWARFSSCTSTYTAGTSTPTPLWRSCMLHLSVSLLYHLRRARRTSWQLFAMSNCFWAIEIWHGCHWWSKQHTLSSSNSLTSCADNCVCLREPASFHTQHAFTHRTLTHSAFTHGKRLHTHTQQAF